MTRSIHAVPSIQLKFRQSSDLCGYTNLMHSFCIWVSHLTAFVAPPLPGCSGVEQTDNFQRRALGQKPYGMVHWYNPPDSKSIECTFRLWKVSGFLNYIFLHGCTLPAGPCQCVCYFVSSRGMMLVLCLSPCLSPGIAAHPHDPECRNSFTEWVWSYVCAFV